MVASMSGTEPSRKPAPIIIGTPARQTLSLSATRRPASLPPGAPLIAVFTYQAPCGFSSGVGRVPPSRGYFTGGILVRHGVERGIGRDQRREDVLHRVEIVHARIHAELLGGVAQIGDAGFLERWHGVLRRD